MAKVRLYCVVYRTGGTDNFKWQHSLAMPYQEALQAHQDMTRKGYKSYVYEWASLLTIGMPETFD